MMARFLRSLETKALVGDKEAGIRWTGSASRVIVGGQPPWLGWSTQRAVTDGYEREPLVFRAIHALAVAISRLPVVLRQDDPWYGEILDTTEDPLLTILNRRANIMEFGSSFRYRLVTQLVLSQRGVFVERVRSKAGDLIVPTKDNGYQGGLHLLPPDITFPIPPTIEELAQNPGMLVKTFEVRVPGAPVQQVPPEDVCWIRWPHPTDVYSGVTPIRALALSIDTSHAARLYNRRFLSKDGRPGGILAVKGGMQRDEKIELQRRMSGPDNIGETSVVNSDKVDYVDIASRPRDMAYKEQRLAMKEEIFTGIGTPESMAGNASGRTFANADAERENWYVDNVMPTAELIGQALSIWTAGGESDGVVVGFNTSKIAVLQRFDRERNAFHLQEGLAGALTRTEYREKIGLTGFTKEQKDDLFVPNPDAPPPPAPGGPTSGDPNGPAAGQVTAGGPPKPRLGVVPHIPGGASLGGSKDERDHPLELAGARRPHGFTRKRTSGLRR